MNENIQCPNCGSSNVNAQMVTDTKLKTGHGFFWWLFIGWWWKLIEFLVFGLFMFFLPKKQKLKQKHKSLWVCQNCGHHWKTEEF